MVGHVTWQLKFNAEKCKVMHMGHYFATKYYMGEGSTRKELESVGLQQERDLGVITISDLKSSSQCLVTTKLFLCMTVIRKKWRYAKIIFFNTSCKLYLN